eukprot:COSAG05_NODE_7996_length_747_cov_60.310875_1_plen_99_part_00
MKYSGKKFASGAGVGGVVQQSATGRIAELRKGKLCLLHAPDFSDWEARKRLAMQVDSTWIPPWFPRNTLARTMHDFKSFNLVFVWGNVVCRRRWRVMR